MPIKLLIADDDSLIRESLKIILGMDEEFEVIECAKDGFQAVQACIDSNIDVALVDIQMPVLNGVGAIKEITKKTATKCIILTTFDDDQYIIDAVKSGAKGYLLKNNTPEKIKDAIKMVNSGSTVMQDVVLDKIRNDIGKERKGQIDITKFTEREIEIMELISKGLSNGEISKELFISEGTVKNYISSILNKTDLNHRTQIAIYYINGGRI